MKRQNKILIAVSIVLCLETIIVFSTYELSRRESPSSGNLPAPETTPQNSGGETNIQNTSAIPPGDTPEETPAFCQNKEIDISSDLNRDFTIDYCTHLKNPNGMKIYFAYDDSSLIIYAVREMGGRDYLLDLLTLSSSRLPYQYVPINVYANGERIVITSFNESEIIFKLEDNCPENYPYCNSVPENTNNSYSVKNGQFEYFYNKELFRSDKTRDDYVNKAITKDQASIDFLRDNLGVSPPIDKFVQFTTYVPDTSGVSYSGGFWIINRWTEKITDEFVKNFLYGNTHEFVHVFFYGTPVSVNWFEEGLADYMGHSQRGNSGLFCRDDGWENGYYDFDGNFVQNSPFVPYSDFSVFPQTGVEFYSPLNKSSYYRSAECFWIYIKEKYGDDSIKNVARAWQDTRILFPPKKKWLIKDIVNPSLGDDLTNLIYKRYNYIEE